MTAGARYVYLRLPDDDGSREASPFCCITVNNIAHRSLLVPVAVVY
jgi:hypothetical protein